jgi:sulfate adenylyltransferase subunit 2
MMNHLKLLEEESISIIRDTFSSSDNPVVLYSIGKDSSVLLELFKRSFYPSKISVKFLHIDTGWKFKEMIQFRDKIFKNYNLDSEVFMNLEGKRDNVNPFNNDKYTEIMKTEALKQALNRGGYDFIYGGARRDEESSRSKEKILSHRDKNHSWDPVKQKIEPWLIFNTYKNKDESFRIFPISNWTELNVWEYIESNNINVVPLYFSKKRKVIVRKNQFFLYDDKRFELREDDKIQNLNVRFRTLGCYPLTSAIMSNAKSVKDIILELKSSKYSERSGRLIDHDQIGSMEIKKKEGYF